MTSTLTDEKGTERQESERQADRETLAAQADERAREATVCVVGLGYVGLPLAVGFARASYRVIGYDIDESRVEMLRDGVDATGELGDAAIREGDVAYTTSAAEISEADYVVVTVPTPVDEDGRPDLAYVEAAGETVGANMTAGTTVILESTVYPGATREVLVPALERTSELIAGTDFFVGYSPERATPGDDDHGLADVVKVVGARDEAVREDVAALYESVVDAGVHRASSIEVAEAAKVIENVQRDVNIALVNELAMAFERLGVDTREVLEAARTKWNFHDYRPGLVGGHCIPVDPYFLVHRARRAGADPELIATSRKVNESMPDHVAEMTIRALTRCGKALADSRVLVLGLTYKPDVADIRSSKVSAVVDRLHEFGVDVAGYDPHVDAELAKQAFDVDVLDALTFDGFDGVLVATWHSAFDGLDIEAVTADLADEAALVDVAGAFDPTELPAGIIYRRV